MVVAALPLLGNAQFDPSADEAASAEIESLLRQSYELMQSDFEASLRYAQRAAQLAADNNDRVRQGQAYIRIADAQMFIGDYTAFDTAMAQAIAIGESEPEIACRARVSATIANKNRGLYTRALASALEAIETCRDYGDPRFYWSALFNTASVHIELGDPESAVPIYRLLIDTNGDLLGTGSFTPTPRDLASVENALGIVELDRGDGERAADYFRAALARIPDDQYERSRGIYLFNLGEASLLAGQYRLAADYTADGQAILEQIKFELATPAGLANQALAYANLNQSERAVGLADQALQTLAQIDSPGPDLAIDIHEKVARTFELANLFEQANQQRQRVSELRKSFYKEERASEIARFQTELELGAKQREVERLNYVNSLQDLALNEQQNVLTAVITGVILLGAASLGIGWLAYRNHVTSRALRGANHALQDSNRERESLIQEINHRVKNNLQVILGLLQLQDNRLTDNDRSPNQVSPRRVLRDIQGRIEAMALIHQQLNHNGLTNLVQMKPFLAQLTQQLGQLYGGIATISSGADELELGLDQALPLGLIASEMVSNAVKYAFPAHVDDPQITITLSTVEDDTIVLRVGDNGIGFGETARHGDESSLGITLIETLSRQIDGDVRLESGESRGTLWVVRFPRTIATA
ncbi:MAG: histidine kinase dimerization/phosphoacceptor domain -containing protein [Pseudomonadota bacterium]